MHRFRLKWKYRSRLSPRTSRPTRDGGGESNGKDAYTGLIVDARGTKLRPSALLAFKMTRVDGVQRWTRGCQRLVQETGTNASFVKSMKDAKAAEGIKSGHHSSSRLFVPATRPRRYTHQDASHFGKSDINYTFLRNAQVIVVID